MKGLRFRDIHWLGKKTIKTVKLTTVCGFTWEYNVNGELMDSDIVDFFIGRDYYVADKLTACVSCVILDNNLKETACRLI